MERLNENTTTREVSISVTLKNASTEISKTLILRVRGNLTLAHGANSEEVFRKTIDRWTGLEKKVLTDLYRNGVRGNFTRFNRRGGIEAEQQMLMWYPDYGTLPQWNHLSEYYNANGVILKYLLEHGDKHRQEDLILAGILVALIKARVFGEKTQLTYEPSTLQKISQLEKRITDKPTAAAPPTFSASQTSDFQLPEELSVEERQRFREGGTTQITVNRYERDSKARKRCIAHYGASCVVCSFNFATVYGEAGRDVIHVHHLQPISSIGQSREVDPIRDLRPVCPNCHTMIHRRDPIYSIEEVKEMLRKTDQNK